MHLALQQTGRACCGCGRTALFLALCLSSSLALALYSSACLYPLCYCHCICLCLSGLLCIYLYTLTITHTHIHSLSLVLVVMIKSKELKTKISLTHSLILSLVLAVFHPGFGTISGMCARNVCAPMVRQSELPFRMLVRQWGCQLCYSPMVPAVQYLEGNHAEREALFSTCKGEAV